MNNKKYELIILCGKAGAGKDYLLQEVLKQRQDILNPLVSDTTRPKRTGETDGVEYNFISSMAEFFNREHLEITSYTVAEDMIWLYGTPKSALKEDKINIGVLNPDGIKQLYEKYDDINIHIFYISANDRTRILRQINREKYPDYKEICRRFLADEEDFECLWKYPTRKINNSENFEGNQGVSVIVEFIDELKHDSDRMS